MKKIIALFVAALIIMSLAACQDSTKDPTATANNDSKTIVATIENDKTVEVSDILISEYREGLWDGAERRMGDGITYYVDNETGDLVGVEKKGEHVVRNEYGTPDIPNFIAWSKAVRATDGSGMYVVNSDYSHILYCFRGEVVSSTRIEEFPPMNWSLQFLAFGDDYVAIKFGQTLAIYDPKGDWKSVTFDEVLDVCVDEAGVLRFSKIAGAYPGNYIVKDDLSTEEEGTHFVKFPRPLNMYRDGFSTETGLFVGFGIGGVDDGRFYYLLDNGDGKTYTLHFKDGVKDSVVKDDVIDAVGDITGVVFIHENGKVYRTTPYESVPKLVFSGTAYVLVTPYYEGDPVYAVTTEEEATKSDYNGWSCLYDITNNINA